MSAKIRQLFIVLLAVIMLVTTACAGNNNAANPSKGAQTQTPQMNKVKQLNNNTVQPLSTLNQDVAIKIVSRKNESYVPLNKLTKLLNYNIEWDPSTLTYSIGDTGVEYEIKVNSTQALKEEETIRLKSAPILINGAPHIPVAAIADLFQEDMVYEITDDSLLIQPSLTPLDLGDMGDGDETITNDELDFKDDPNDPFKEQGDTGEAEASVEDEAVWMDDQPRHMVEDEAVWLDEQTGDSIPAAKLKNVNINSMISTAKRYLGVNYKFGAKAYPKSGKFDCSTYTKYIYGKYGIKLPRTARAQAQKGSTVSRKSLRKGDLLYFNVPGRFKSNKVVGHVGIYIGNGKMIHASPKPKNGVQITNINKKYWKKTFLKAKRVVY